jgi:hypothetical protein
MILGLLDCEKMLNPKKKQQNKLIPIFIERYFIQN